MTRILTETKVGDYNSEEGWILGFFATEHPGAESEQRKLSENKHWTKLICV